MAWSRETVANSSRLFFWSDASASSTPQNRVIVCAASFASCSAGESEVEDGVGVVGVLVTEVVVEGVGLGSFAVQADVAVIAATASVAAIRCLAFVISGTPRDLTSPKAVCAVQAVNPSQSRCVYTSAFESNRFELSPWSGPRVGGFRRTLSPRSPAASDCSDGVLLFPQDNMGPHLARKCSS